MRNPGTFRLSTTALPEIAQKIHQLREMVNAARQQGKTVGVVMTMGALHAGHLSLVESSCRATEFTVVTIYVNPTQFLPDEDYDAYPRQLDQDLARLAELEVDLVFVPDDEEMYPVGCSAKIQPPKVARLWEGKCRPGHFEGVATIVVKMINATQPDVTFFGRKDYQQYIVIRDLVRDLCLPTRIVVCPTVREPDGLALSSRNQYLTGQQRKQALGFSQALRRAQELFQEGVCQPKVLVSSMRKVLIESGITKIDYVTVVDPDTLEEVDQLDGDSVACVAGFVGSTRLIDNMTLQESPRR